MMTTMTAKQALDREFLEMRSKVLELAASFDRLEQREGDVASDPRLLRLKEALGVLLAPEEDRAEQVQLIFSRSYDPTWREKFGLVGSRKAK
ncbi:MAG: hypothetical protein AB7O38_29675 [Pirellulaceae bacterium]